MQQQVDRACTPENTGLEPNKAPTKQRRRLDGGLTDAVEQYRLGLDKDLCLGT